MPTQPTTAQHTPGPWKINSVYQTLVDAPSGACGGSRLICSTEVGNKNGDAYDWQIDQQNAANARLIAASPDLLAQLRNIEHVAAKNAEHGSADWAFVRDTARLAIQRATA